MEHITEGKIQVVTPLNLKTGKVFGKSWRVSAPNLWTRSDAEMKYDIRRAASRPGKYRDIRLACEAVGWDNVVFRREWM